MEADPAGWPRHRENREFGYHFFQTWKTQEILAQHRDNLDNMGNFPISLKIMYFIGNYPFTDQKIVGNSFQPIGAIMTGNPIHQSLIFERCSRPYWSVVIYYEPRISQYSLICHQLVYPTFFLALLCSASFYKLLSCSYFSHTFMSGS